MNTMSLSNLYRRATAGGAAPAVDADALLAVLAGKPADALRRAEATRALAESAAHADLARMLGELQIESEQLATQVQRLRAPARRQGDVARRHAHVVHLRWFGAMAASLVLAVGAFMLHERSERQQMASVTGAAGAAHVAATSDRIFASGEELRQPAAPAAADRLFRSDFSEGS
ncbi:MAG: hypothetical protein KF903_08265 [Dokdonella sp.]|uniref:hypothetical protein n=1 Tax=Dokdonella sp. TaxID=2291710 RepID=UPI0025C0D66E|nr:hypothetical protein [Dokdonella sp.]MBX3700974.1 hypothetical protein [Dokdonella sp.]